MTNITYRRPKTDTQLRDAENQKMIQEAIKTFGSKVKEKLSTEGLRSVQLLRETVEKTSRLDQKVQDQGVIIASVKIEPETALKVIDELIKEYTDNQPKSEGGLF